MRTLNWGRKVPRPGSSKFAVASRKDFVVVGGSQSEFNFTVDNVKRATTTYKMGIRMKYSKDNHLLYL